MLTEEQALTVVADVLRLSQAERERLARVDTYVDGDYRTQHYIPTSPSSVQAAAEYAALIERSRVPILSLVVDAIVQNLYVDGFRRRGSQTMAPGWESWQRNRMDARQGRIARGVVAHGAANLVIGRGTDGPLWRPLTARQMSTAWEDREADEWPLYAVERRTTVTPDGPRDVVVLYDEQATYRLENGALVAVAEHGAPHVPVVGFSGLPSASDAIMGEVWPLIPLQDQVDAYTFMIEMASVLAVHRQRWATGLAIPEDPETGKPLEPFRAALDRLWVSEDSETRFGEFGQTDIKPWLEGREATLRHICVKSQTPPGSMLAQLINFPSAEALAASEMQHQRHVGDYRMQLGEDWEKAFRLDAWYRGDSAGWEDTTAQVAWRDTGARSLAQTVDAWGKAVSLLKVPAEATWEKIPGMTETDLDRWRRMAAAEERRKADAAATAMGFTLNAADAGLQQQGPAAPGDQPQAGPGAAGSAA